jgi:hypothetical protein
MNSKKMKMKSKRKRETDAVHVEKLEAPKMNKRLDHYNRL